MEDNGSRVCRQGPALTNHESDKPNNRRSDIIIGSLNSC